MKIDNRELKILQILDSIIREESVRIEIDAIVQRVEQKLNRSPEVLLTWEPVSLRIYGERLPDMIRSSWVFALRARSITGAERHPNSHQRMMSYRGSGDLQIQLEGEWISNHLVSDAGAPIQNRWVSIPPRIWHQAVVPDKNWVVVSFHTVPANQLIEERPDSTNPESVLQRWYWKQS